MYPTKATKPNPTKRTWETKMHAIDTPMTHVQLPTTHQTHSNDHLRSVPALFYQTRANGQQWQLTKHDLKHCRESQRTSRERQPSMRHQALHVTSQT